jgi:hypothetical protein
MQYAVLLDNTVLQDGMHSHWELQVRIFMDPTSGDDGCGRGTPDPWSPNFPDHPNEFLVCRHGNIANDPTLCELKAKIFPAFATETLEMLAKTWKA